MRLVQRANKQLRVPDDKLEYYLALGYREVGAGEGASGKPTRKSKM